MHPDTAVNKKTRFRDPVSGYTHLASAVVAVLGTLYLLLAGRGSLQREISLLVYGLSLITLFSASATYHLYNQNPKTLLRLRKWDHSAIYILIAGTYTPLCVNVFSGFWQWGLLIIIWAMAVIGIGVKLFIINAPRWVTAGAYLVMSWFAIIGIKEMLATLPLSTLFWLLLGGLFYTGGAIIYITKKMDFFPGVFGFHEVWHIFVMLGAFSHFVFIVLAVL
jgi:hemolysin III